MSYDPPPPPPEGSVPPPPEGYGQQPSYGQPASGGYGQQPPGGYGQAPPGGYGQSPLGAGPAKNSTLAIVSLVTGILGIPCCGCFILAIVAAITGYLAKKEIAESNGTKTGAGMAQAGFILGIIGIVLGVIALGLNVAGVIDTNYTSNFN